MVTCVPECTCYKIVKSVFYDQTNVILRVVVKEGFYCSVTCTFIQTLSLTSMTSEVRVLAAMLEDGCGCSGCGQ